MKAADYGTQTNAAAAFVSTNSICQGQQVPILWPLIFETGHEIAFAHTSFKWANLASHNAGVTVVIVGIPIMPVECDGCFRSPMMEARRQGRRATSMPTWLPAPNVIVRKQSKPLAELAAI